MSDISSTFDRSISLPPPPPMLPQPKDFGISGRIIAGTDRIVVYAT
jgi:hypothetical protein